jgi:hypothetical protein
VYKLVLRWFGNLFYDIEVENVIISYIPVCFSVIRQVTETLKLLTCSGILLLMKFFLS